MIRFTCKCGKHIKVEDKYAGKKGKCPQCKEAVRIPQSDNTGLVDASIDNLSEKPTTQPIPTKKTARSTSNSSAQIHTPSHGNQQLENSSKIWYFYVVISLFVISALLYVFVFRDTWEIDHFVEISEMIRETQNYISEKDYEEATKNYNKLSALVEGRHLKRESLNNDVANIQEEYYKFEKEEKRRQAIIAEEARRTEKIRLAEEARLAKLREAEARWSSMTPLERLIDIVSHIESIENQEKAFRADILQEPYTLTPLNIEETADSFFKRLAQINPANRGAFTIANPNTKIKFQSLIVPKNKGYATRSYFMATLYGSNLGWKVDVSSEGFFTASLPRGWKRFQGDKEFELSGTLYYTPIISHDSYMPSNKSFIIKFNFGVIENSYQICEHFNKDNFILLLWELDLNDISISIHDEKEKHGHERLDQYGRDRRERYEYNADVYEYQLVSKDHPYVKKFENERAERRNINKQEAIALEAKLNSGGTPRFDESRIEHARKADIRRKKRMQELESERIRHIQEQENLPHAIVENILNIRDDFRTATFTGTTNKGGGEISYNYDVEYVTGGGFVRIGKFNVAIINGECREVYFNGGALWTQIMDPRLKGYKDP